MARSFDVSTVTPATVAQIHAAFADENYWRDRLEVYGGNGVIRLDSLTVGSDGAIAIATTQDLREGVLPGPLSKALPSTLRLLRAETWRPAADGRVHGEVRITAHGLAGSALGKVDLAPIADGSATGSLMRFAGTVKVGIPLVGGQIEKFVAAQIVKEIPGLGTYTNDWIIAHD